VTHNGVRVKPRTFGQNASGTARFKLYGDGYPADLAVVSGDRIEWEALYQWGLL